MLTPNLAAGAVLVTFFEDVLEPVFFVDDALEEAEKLERTKKKTPSQTAVNLKRI